MTTKTRTSRQINTSCKRQDDPSAVLAQRPESESISISEREFSMLCAERVELPATLDPVDSLGAKS